MAKRYVTKAQVKKVFAEVKAQYADYDQTDLFVSDMAHIYGGDPKTPVIVWEGGPNYFAITFDTTVPGVYGEAVYSFAQALYVQD